MNLRTLCGEDPRRRSVARDDRLCRPTTDGARGRSLTGAGYGEKSQGRLAHRNGYRDRIWETRAGSVDGAASRVD
jgi:putative transposase